jgi:biotin carboxylase
MRPKLAVLFDYGAATAAEIGAAAKPVCDLVFVADPTSESVAGVLPILKALGTVVEDTGSVDEVGRRLLELEVTGIVTFTEFLVARTAAVAARCGLSYHSEEVAAALTDKNLQRRRLADGGVRTPRFVTIDGPADVGMALDAVGVPAVLKPRSGGGSRNTTAVAGRADLVAAVDEFLAGGETALVLEEQLIGDPSVAGPQWGDYVSVESVTVGGETRQIGVTGKLPLLEPFREQGHFFPAQIPAETYTQACQVTTEAIRALGIVTGVSHTELKLTGDGPVVIEVNGRLGGHISDLVKRSAGIDMIRLAMSVALGLHHAPIDRTAAGPIAFQFLYLPPVGATEVVDVSGAAELRGVAGVKRVEVLLGPGSKVSWNSGSASMVAIVYGSAPDVAALAAARDDIYARFRPTYSER